MPEPYQDPSMEPGSIHVTAYETGDGWIIEKREFNRFQDDEVPSQAQHRTEKITTSPPHEHAKDGKCWTEQQFETYDYITRSFIKKQWVEYWQIDLKLKDYYNKIHEYEQAVANAADTAASEVQKIAGVAGFPSGKPPSEISAIKDMIKDAPQAAAELSTIAAAGMTHAALSEAAVAGTATQLGNAAVTATALTLEGAANGLTALGTAASATASVAVPIAVAAGTLVVAFSLGTQVTEHFRQIGDKYSEGWQVVGKFSGPEELVKMTLGVDVGPIHDCPKKQTRLQWPGGYWRWLLVWLIGIVALVLILATVLFGGFFTGQSQSRLPASAPPAATVFVAAPQAPTNPLPSNASVNTIPAPTETLPLQASVQNTIPAPAETLPSQASVLITVPALAVVPPSQSTTDLGGNYIANLTIASDPDNDAQFIAMPPTIATHVTIGSITVSGPAPWVTVVGPLNPDGTFVATGAGDVAGRHVIGVELVGKITPSGLSGDYSMGVRVPAIVNGRQDFGGFLPSGKPVIFHVDGKREGAPSPTQAPPAAPLSIDARLKTFVDNFVPALRTNNTTFLFQHLHPAVLSLYGSDQCQNSLRNRSADPTYNIVILGVQGPASWQWVASGISTGVQNVYTLDANITGQGRTERTQAHFGLVEDNVDWFTVCGNPLVTPTPTR